MPKQSKFLLIAILFSMLSGGCATKKVYAPSSFLRLGTIKDISNSKDSEEKNLGLNIAEKLSDHLGYKLSYSEVMKENLTDSLTNKKFDLILAPKSLAKDFPMLKEPQGFYKLQEELSKLSEEPSLAGTPRYLAALNEQSDLEKFDDGNSLTLFVHTEKDLLSSFETLISNLINQSGPIQLFSQWGLALK